MYNCVKLCAFRTLSYKIKLRNCQNRISFLIFALKFNDNKVKLVLLSILMLAVAVFLIGIKVFCVKGGRFRIGHAHELDRRR